MIGPAMSSLGGDRSGEVLGGRYALVRRIGTGGMGAVYEAIQSDLGRRVAVKVLHSHLSLEPTLLERFRREALAAAALGHPNIVSVSDLQSPAEGPPFLVMELLTGPSLKQAIVHGGRLEPHRVAYIAAQVLSALGAAHAERVVHRDVKPDNIILIDTTAMRDFVKVLDFGVAKLQRENVEGLTVAGAILGTLSYMAPEQARGEELDGRADVYSVGACMYHALAGKKPFERKSKAELYAAVILEPPPSLEFERPDVDPKLIAIIEHALQKKPADRFKTAEEMVRELVAWQSAQGAHPSLPPPGAPRSPSLTPVTPSSHTPVETPRASKAPSLSSKSSRSGKTRRELTSEPEPKTLAAPRTKRRMTLAIAWIVVVSIMVGVLIERLYAVVLAR
jgi:serine/threonine-protein kinase